MEIRRSLFVVRLFAHLFLKIFVLAVFFMYVCVNYQIVQDCATRPCHTNYRSSNVGQRMDPPDQGSISLGIGARENGLRFSPQ